MLRSFACETRILLISLRCRRASIQSVLDILSPASKGSLVIAAALGLSLVRKALAEWSLR